MILLAISGKKGSGKNTVADIITNHIKSDKLPVYQLAFADALKDEVCKACGITRKYLEEHKDNFRLILQGWGTEFRRKLSKEKDDYWILQWLATARSYDNNSLVLVPDCRFKNEYKIIKDLGGFVWRVERPSLNSKDSHQSETELDNTKFDETIINDHTLNSLEFIVKEKINSLLTKTLCQ